LSALLHASVSGPKLCAYFDAMLWCSQKYGEEYTVAGIDKEAKVATLANGMKIQYEALVSTMPLDLTLHWLGQPEWAEELSHRSAISPHHCSAKDDYLHAHPSLDQSSSLKLQWLSHSHQTKELSHGGVACPQQTSS